MERSSPQSSLIPVNAIRKFLLIYNPSERPLTVSMGTPAFGARGSILLGPGEALIGQTAYREAMTVVGYLGATSSALGQGRVAILYSGLTRAFYILGQIDFIDSIRPIEGDDG